MIVAIDGPAGTGKSTIAHRIADKAGFLYLNSGNLYRAITWQLIQQGIHTAPESVQVKSILRVRLESSPTGVALDGRHLESELRDPSVTEYVAIVSSGTGIREVVNEHLRECAAQRDVIAEGRDMTTVVFPQAEVRIFLDATIESRAARRFAESTSATTLDEVRNSIAERDHIDKTKPFGALKLDPSALYIDSSNLTVDQVCAIVLNAILRTRAKSTSTGAIGQS